MHITILGVDLGKNVCSVVGLDRSGAVVLRRRARRETLIELTAKLSFARFRRGARARGERTSVASWRRRWLPPFR
jgi:hypothetical protein